MEVGENQSKRGSSRLQESREARGDVLLRPKHKTVVDSKGQNSCNCQQKPMRARLWQLNTADSDKRKEDRKRDDKPDAREREWRKVRKAELDEEPGRSPDAAEY